MINDVIAWRIIVGEIRGKPQNVILNFMRSVFQRHALKSAMNFDRHRLNGGKYWCKKSAENTLSYKNFSVFFNDFSLFLKKGAEIALTSGPVIWWNCPWRGPRHKVLARPNFGREGKCMIIYTVFFMIHNYIHTIDLNNFFAKQTASGIFVTCWR